MSFESFIEQKRPQREAIAAQVAEWEKEHGPIVTEPLYPSVEVMPLNEREKIRQRSLAKTERKLFRIK